MEGNLLTERDVHEAEFDLHGIFRKNYDATQVDEFLDRVEATLHAIGVGLRKQGIEIPEMKEGE